MPTDLPRSRRRHPDPTKAAAAPKPTALSRLLNTFMIGTALALFALVLMQEKRYADGVPGTVADAFVQQAMAALSVGNAQADDAAPPN